MVGVGDKLGVGIALHHRQAMGDGALHLLHVDLNAAGVAVFFAEQMVDERAVGAADVEHARTGGDEFGDEREIDADFFRQSVHASPACSAQPARNPRSVLWKSGSSSRNASCPL